MIDLMKKKLLFLFDAIDVVNDTVYLENHGPQKILIQP